MADANRVTRPVPPRIAATIREEDEALAATIETANAILAAAMTAAFAAVDKGKARHAAAMRPILRALKIDEGTCVRIDGFGAETMLTIELPEEKRNA